MFSVLFGIVMIVFPFSGRLLQKRLEVHQAIEMTVALLLNQNQHLQSLTLARTVTR